MGKKTSVIISVMCSLCFSANSQPCLRTVDDEFCKQAKMAISLGANIESASTDNAQTYIMMKKLAANAKSIKCQKIDNVKNEEIEEGYPEYFVYTDDWSYVLFKLHGLDVITYFEVDGLGFVQRDGGTGIVDPSDFGENIKKLLLKTQCKESPSKSKKSSKNRN